MISVITPSLPERSKYLIECIKSFTHQTLQPSEHLISIDYARVGPCIIRNTLAKIARSPWITFFDDDDLAYPNHLELLFKYKNDADIVYSLFDLQLKGSNNIIKNKIPDDENINKRIFLHKVTPVTFLIRKEVFLELEGFKNLKKFEDLEFYKLAYKKDFKFKCVEETTWLYRRLSKNRLEGTV